VGLARGWIYLACGNGSAAAETLWSVRDLGEDHHQRHFIRGYLGLTLIGLGRHAAAATTLSEAMSVIIELGNVRGAAACVECCGYLCQKLGQWRDATQFLAAAGAIRARTEVPLFNFWLPFHQAAHAALRAALGAEDYAACARLGAARRTEDAINEANLWLKSLAAGS
jgi:hypothetical protein